MSDVDVVVVGAGFSGLYLLHRLGSWGSRPRCSTPPAMSAEPGTGTVTPAPAATSRRPTTPTASTRSWNASGPGPRSTRPNPRSWPTCDTSPTATTCAATSTSRRRVESAVWDEAGGALAPATDRGDEVSCRFYVMASGCLSLPKSPDIEGRRPVRRRGLLHQHAGRTRASTSAGKRVAVIGTGSSGIQSIPLIAAAGRPAHRVPAHPELLHPGPQRAASAERLAALAADRDGYREAARWSRGGVPIELTEHQRDRRHRGGATGALRGGLGGGRAVRHPRRLQRPGFNPASNEIVAEMIREKIRVDRGRPRHRRSALPEGPPLRHQAPLPRHRLLQDLQPAPRPPRRPAQAPDRHHHRVGDRHRGRVPGRSTPSCTPPDSTP